VKYSWIDAQRGTYPLNVLCAALSVSPSGYRAWKAGGCARRARLSDAHVLELIRGVHAQFRGAYGSPRMLRELRARGIAVAKTRVERLMRDNGIRACHKRRYRSTTDSKHAFAVANNLLERRFEAAQPNKIWTADMTYIWTGEGFLYLAVVLDLFNREVVGWSIRSTMSTQIVIDALKMACMRRQPAPGVIHHSDRGSQYASHAFQAELARHGMVCSMSRKGNCWDNAPSESFFNSLKNERVHTRHYATHHEAQADLFDYIEVFYNRSRRHSTLGYLSPSQFMDDWIGTQKQANQAA
jgi:putative transposase